MSRLRRSGSERIVQIEGVVHDEICEGVGVPGVANNAADYAGDKRLRGTFALTSGPRTHRTRGQYDTSVSFRHLHQ